MKLQKLRVDLVRKIVKGMRKSGIPDLIKPKDVTELWKKEDLNYFIVNYGRSYIAKKS